MDDFVIKLVLSALLTLLIKGLVAMVHHSIAWWLAVVIALVVVFGGWVIVVDSDGWDW